MKSKLISISMILMLSAFLAIAQDAEKEKTSFGVVGGINFQNMIGNDGSGDKLTNDINMGYHAGGNIQIPIVTKFYFQPGLIYSTKGAKNQYTLLGTTYTKTTTLSYIEMPLNLVYKALLGNGYFMLGFGPYVAYGFSGKVVTKGGDVSLDQDIRFQNVVETNEDLTVPYYKSLDIGGNVFAGYELSNGIFAQFNSQLGMIKINPEYKIRTDDKSAVKNTGFGLSLGYRF